MMKIPIITKALLACLVMLAVPLSSFSQSEVTKKTSAVQTPATIGGIPATQTPLQKARRSIDPHPSPEEYYALQKLRIQIDLEEEIMKWAQTRFWFIAIISLLIGFFGVRALVRDFVSAELKDAMRASAEAQAAAQSARESIKEVRLEATKYKDLVDTASSTAAAVNDKLQELKSRIDSEGARSVAASDLKVSAISEQIEGLRQTVRSLASDSERARDILKQADSRIAQVREAAKTSEAEFTSNANINVILVPHTDQLSKSLAAKISSSLTQRGFKVSQAPWGGPVKIGRDISIEYQPVAKEKAKLVYDVVRSVFDATNLQNKMTMEQKDNPISNNPDGHVVVFFR